MNPSFTLAFLRLGKIAPWDAAWVCFTAPPLGMLLAAEAYARSRGASAVWCAKLHHHNDRRCIFQCGRPAA